MDLLTIASLQLWERQIGVIPEQAGALWAGPPCARVPPPPPPGFPARRGSAPRRPKLSRGNSGRCERALGGGAGRGGAAAYKKGRATGLRRWNHGAC